MKLIPRRECDIPIGDHFEMTRAMYVLNFSKTDVYNRHGTECKERPGKPDKTFERVSQIGILEPKIRSDYLEAI